MGSGRGVPPKWSKWRSFRHIASSLGKMLGIDWNSLFFSFFSMIRIKFVCNDISKIPKRRLFEMDNKFYLVQFKVEGSAEADEDGADDGGGDNGDLAEEEDIGMEELQHDSMSNSQKHHEGRGQTTLGPS
jgi:hypothetical protein